MTEGRRPTSWHLMLGDTRLGTLTHVSSNQPWFNATFRQEADFEHVRAIFDEEWTLHQSLIQADKSRIDVDTQPIVDMLIRIKRLDLRLLMSDGSGEQKFEVLHIHGDTAEFTPYW
jgi:hypothetical protein